MVKLSVIMPSLNVRKYIVECIESIIYQTLRDIEIICVDAGSDDGTLEILYEYEAKDTRIRVVESEIKSYGYQVNLGIQEAKGEYIAIVETDDYINNDMLNRLVEVADRDQLDVVKAEYSSFFEKDNRRITTKSKSFENHSEYFNKIFNRKKDVNIYISDVNVWRGIYRKNFIVETGIRFSESPRAAYQDIGFVFQTLMYAQRLEYIEDNYYMYRTDRDESSSYSIKALQNARYEYERLFDLVSKDALDIDLKALYIKAIMSFKIELDKVIVKSNYNSDTEYIRNHIEWYKNVFDKGNALGYFNNEFFSRKMLDDLKLIFTKLKEYVRLLKITNDNKSIALEKLADNNAVIFGAGKRGDNILKILLGHNIEVNNIIDNNRNLYGKRINDIEVCGLSSCIHNGYDGYFVIANKNHEDDIYNQLLDAGIANDKIIRGSILI